MIPLALYYIRWHYSYALSDIIGIIRNFLWFFYEFFSIPLLLKTLFVPFHRLSETAHKGFDPSAWAEAFMVTTMMRVVGAFLRILLIGMGVLFLVLTLLGGMFILAVWVFAPAMLIFLFGSGLTLITVG
jgi:hypothetical protein